jgi:hypothetical protein
MAALSSPTPVQLYITIGGNSVTETITLGTSDYTISPKAYTFTVLRGTIGDVTVNGGSVSNVSIYAKNSSGNRYWGPTNNNDWEIHIPGTVSGSLTIGVQAQYGGNWTEQDVDTWNSSSSPSGISLGNVDFSLVILSGTIGTVTVNGGSAVNLSIYAKTSTNNYWTPGDSPWQIGLPNGFSGNATIGVQFGYNGGWYEKDLITQPVSGASIAGIDLGTPTITLTPIGGTVTTNGSVLLDYGQLLVFDPAGGTPNEQSQPLGYAEISNGTFSDYVVGSMTTGYVVIQSGGNYYITGTGLSPSPVSIGSSMSLNLANMILVQGN